MTTLVIALLAGVLSGCVAQSSAPSLPGAGDCIMARDTSPQLWFRWDGQYGDGAHVRTFSDGACTHLTEYRPNYMSVAGPEIPLPTGRDSWDQVPGAERNLAAAPYGWTVVRACMAAHPGGEAATGVTLNWFGTSPNSPTQVRVHLWGCILEGLPGTGVWPDQPDE